MYKSCIHQIINKQCISPNAKCNCCAFNAATKSSLLNNQETCSTIYVKPVVFSVFQTVGFWSLMYDMHDKFLIFKFLTMVCTFFNVWKCVTVQVWENCVFPRKVVNFSVLPSILSCTKKVNFPPSTKISQRGASQLPNFLHPWCVCVLHNKLCTKLNYLLPSINTH